VREFQVPSYRVRDLADEGGSRRIVAVAGGLAGLLAVGSVIGWAVTSYTDTTIPVVQADSRPVKIRPEDRGGLRVANQDEIIFERRDAHGTYEPSGRLGPAAEAPNLDALRAATAPPPAATPRPTAPVMPPATAPTPFAAAPLAPEPAPAATPSVPPAPAPAPVQAQPAAPAAPPTAVPTPAPVLARATGGVVVQLGALDSEGGARTEWERLSRRVPELQGRSPQIIRFERDGRPTMWRLRTSGFESRAAASSFCESVKSQGGACAVIGG